MTRRVRTYPARADAPFLALLGTLLGWGVGLIAGALYALIHRSTNYGNH